MKMYTLAITLLMFLPVHLFGASPSPSRINRLLEFIAHQSVLRDSGLYLVMAKRCNSYLSYSESKPCRKAVRRQIKLLDYDILFTKDKIDSEKDAWTPSFVFIAFKKALIDTLSDPETTVYLDQLKLGLNAYLTGSNDQFNIWDMTLEFYQSPLIAAKTMAALFQDTSIIKLHLAYLEKTGSRGRMSFDANLDSLSKVIDTINLILDYSEDRYRSLFYPKPIRENLNRNIYHFYVPLYLAMAMASEGIPHKYALAAPLILTLSYEFITLASDLRYLYKDPKNLDPNKAAHTLRDIFASYSGANFGLGKNISPGIFVLMKESFARSSEDGISLLLQSAN